jgi:tripartite ATP-independent transporter DctM subunit
MNTLLLGPLLLLALAGLPFYLVLGGLALLGFAAQGLNPGVFFAEVLRLTENPALVAVPLFILAGYILAESRASERLAQLAGALLGWLPGGMAVATLLVMALFTAFSGASGVTIVAMGGMMLPVLLKGGYDERFSLGMITASGSLGLLFPPSLALILYGVVSGVSISQLFVAGVLPGLILVATLGAFTMQHGWRLRTSTMTGRPALLPACKAAIWEAVLPLVVVGGIYAGFFTAPEAATVTVIYVTVVECFITRDIHPVRDLPRVLKQSGLLVGGILVILGSAMALTNYLVYADVPTAILNWLRYAISSKVTFLLLLNVFLLIIGSIIEIFSALVVVVPLIIPLAQHYGVHPLHLGIIFLMNLEIGYCMPPVGLNLFLASFRFQKPIILLYRAVLPFLIIQLITLALITYIPALTLYPVKLFVTK